MRKTESAIKPPRLKKGDVVGLIAPASTPSAREKVDGAVAYLERLGYRVKVGTHVMDELGYLAGTDEARSSDLNAMLADRSVRAIVALRGGYGTPRLLDKVDYRALRRDPKILVGYSDLTALLLAVYRKTGLVTFSGPMAGVEMWKSIDPLTEEHFWKVITSSSSIGELRNPPEDLAHTGAAARVSGRLIGGNLSLIISLLGTPYVPSFRDAILVVEDVDEAPHRVDRMLTQLRNAGVFGQAKALVLGRFTDCKPSDPSKPHLTIEQVLQEVSATAGIPVLSNFLYGHIPRKFTLPIGVRTVMDPRSASLSIPGSAVR